MVDKGSMLMRLLANRFHQDNGEAFLRPLPEDALQSVINFSCESNDVSPLFKSPQKNIESIHYSWLIPKLQTVPKEKLPLVLAILPEPHASRLKAHFKQKKEITPLTKPMRTFLSGQFGQYIAFDEALPLEYVPKTDMTQIAKFKKGELVDLIDFLGLHDLAEEIHHIVSKKILENINQCLTKKKLQYLRRCMQHKEKLTTQRLQLEHWDGECNKLLKLLHHRGTIRLGYALSGQHPDLIWHITHILDSGRGEKLARYVHKDPIPGVTETLKKQVKAIIDFFNKTSEP